MRSTAPIPLEPHRRAAARLRLCAPAIFVGFEGRQRVKLLDLSQTGAKLAFKEPPSGKAGFLNWLEFETFGELVWRDGLYVGLQFDEAIDYDWLLETRSRAPLIEGEEHRRVLEAARAWVGA